MERERLEAFIKKYNLGGACESVTITASNKTLTVRSMSADKDIIADIVAKDIDVPDGEYNVFDTKRFRSMLNVLPKGNALTVKSTISNKNIVGIDVTDGTTKTHVALADKTVIPAVPLKIVPPPMVTTIVLNNTFIDLFIRAKSALADASKFTVSSAGTDATATITLGDATNSTNNNSVTIVVNTLAAVALAPIQFSATYLRELLIANNEGNDGTLEVGAKKMAIAKFSNDGFDSTYYLLTN